MAQVGEQVLLAQRTREINKAAVTGPETLFMGLHSRVFFPNPQMIPLMNIIDLALPRGIAESDYLTDEMCQAVRLEYNNRSIMTGKEYQNRPRRHFAY